MQRAVVGNIHKQRKAQSKSWRISWRLQHQPGSGLSLQMDGGILKATSGGNLPRGLQQVHVYDLKRANRKAMVQYSWYAFHSNATVQEKGTVFVLDVTCGPQPMAAIAIDQQLLDLEQFCTNPYYVCLLEIDPTFKLDDFNVTPSVYQEVIVQGIHTYTSPIMAGPMLIHQSKLFRSDNHFLWW